MDIRHSAELALQILKDQGFDDAQVSAGFSRQDELNIAHDEASLLRSTEDQRLALLGLLDGRKASTDLTDTREESIRRAARTLFDSVQVAPQDEANAVSSGESADIAQGPQEGDLNLLADKLRELLEFRASETPRMHLEEALCAYVLSEKRLLTTQGSDLSGRIGCYALMAMGTAKDGTHTSSFNYASGSCHDLSSDHAAGWFGIGDMLRETERQILTQPIGAGFSGDVVLAPNAVFDLLVWLLDQVRDGQLLADSSVYKSRVGEQIASPLLSVRSRFDAPGVCAISSDAFAAAPIDLMDRGRLRTLLPSLYGSRKAGLRHVPSVDSGWSIDAGIELRDDLVSGVQRGALVGRLSMGNPAPNGDFAGVVKNSFVIEGGEIGPALSEVMIAGNVAQMLQDVVAVSAERIDSGGTVLPWIRMANLNFS